LAHGCQTASIDSVLSAAHSHTFEERLYLGECEWIPLQDASVPHILGEHSAKAEDHTFKRGTGDFPRNGISVPLKAQCVEQRHKALYRANCQVASAKASSSDPRVSRSHTAVMRICSCEAHAKRIATSVRTIQIDHITCLDSYRDTPAPHTRTRDRRWRPRPRPTPRRCSTACR
jgi:hypothetical protein